MKPDEAQDFAAVLAQHNKGAALDEASKKLTEIIEAVRNTGKTGSITVKLTITRSNDNKRMLKIDDDVKAVVPKEKRRSLWFPDDNNQLHRNDPTQHELMTVSEVKQREQETN